MRKILLAGVAVMALSGVASANSGNEAYIDQVGGYYNQAESLQVNNTNGLIRQRQSGARNEASATQDSTSGLGFRRGTIEQVQIGNRNDVTASQRYTAGARIDQQQYGENNAARATQGSSVLVSIQQVQAGWNN